MTIVLSIGIFAVAILVLTVGLLLNNKPIQPSCGKHETYPTGTTACATCDGDLNSCPVEGDQTLFPPTESR